MIRICRNIPTSISNNITNSLITNDMLTATNSFKVLGECPVIVMFLLQTYPANLKPVLVSLIPLMITILSVSVDSSILSPCQIKRNKELIGAQVKILSFICYFSRGYSDITKPFETIIGKRLFDLLCKCPADEKTARRELLIAIRHTLASDMKSSLLPFVDELLNEKTLLGPDNPDQLRQLAYSTISDLIQHVKAELSIVQISRIVTMFGAILHDAKQTVSIFGMSVKILYGLIERLGVLRKSPVDGHSAVLLLQSILRTFVLKFGCIRCVKVNNDGTIPMPNNSSWLEKLVKSGNVKQNLNNDDVNDCRTQETETARPSPDISDVNIREIKHLIKAIIWNLKPLMALLCDHQAASLVRFGESDESSKLLQNLFVWGLECCALFANKPKGDESKADQAELKEVVETFSIALLALDPRVIRQLLHSRFSSLYKLSITNPVLLIMIQHMLQQVPICIHIIDIILSFFIYNMDDLTHHRRGQSVSILDQKKFMQRTSTLLRILKMVITAVNTFSDTPALQALFQARLRFFILKSIRLAHISRAPFNYLYVLRLMFRGISSSPKAIAEQSMNLIKPMYPSILEGLASLLKRSEHKSLSDLLIELCLTVPAHIKVQLENLHHLLPLMPSALRSQSETINLAFKSIETWVENTSLKTFLSSMGSIPGLTNEILSSIYIHLRPSPYPFGIAAFKLVSRLGIVLNDVERPNFGNCMKHSGMFILGVNCYLCPEEKDSSRMEIENDSVRLDLISLIEGACEMLECLKISVDQSPSEVELFAPLLFSYKDLVDEIESASALEMELQITDSGDVVAIKKDPSLASPSRLQEALETFESNGLDSVSDFNPKAFVPEIALISTESYNEQKRCAFDILWATISNVVLGEEVTVENGTGAISPLLRSESSLQEPMVSLDAEIEILRRMIFAVLLSTTEPALKADALVVLNGLCVHFSRLNQNDSDVNEMYLVINSVVLQAIADFRAPVRQIGNWLLHKWLLSLAEANQESGCLNCRFFQDLLSKSCEACRSIKWATRLSSVKVIHELCFAFSPKLPRVWFRTHAYQILQGLLAVFNVPAQEMVAATEDVYRTLKTYANVIWGEEYRPTVDILMLLVDGLLSSSSMSRMAAVIVIDEILNIFGDTGYAILQEAQDYSRKVLDIATLGIEQHCILGGNVLAGVRHLLIYKLIAFNKPVTTIVACAIEVSVETLPPDSSAGMRKVLDYSSNENLYEEDYQLVSALFPNELPSVIEHQLHTIRLMHSIFINDVKGAIFEETNRGLLHACILYLSKSIMRGHSWVEILVEAHKALSSAKDLAVKLDTEALLPVAEVRRMLEPLFHAIEDVRAYSIATLKGFEVVISFLPTIHHSAIAEKLFKNLQLWSDPSFLQTSSNIWPHGEEQEIAATIINLIQSLQVIYFSTPDNLSTLQTYVDSMIQTVVDIERMRHNYYYCNCVDDSPYMVPLMKILLTFRNEATNFIFNPANFCKGEIVSCLVSLVKVKSPLVRDFISYISSDPVLLLLERDILFNAEVTAHFTQYQVNDQRPCFLSSVSDPTSLMQLPPKSVDVNLPLVSYLNAAFNASLLMRKLAKLRHSLLSEDSKFLSILRRLWSRIVPMCEKSRTDFEANFLNNRIFQEAKYISDSLLEYCRLNPGQPVILFELIDILIITSCPTSFAELTEYLKEEIAAKYSWGDKRNVLQQFFDVYVHQKTPFEWKVKSMQILIYPLTHRILEDASTRELVFDNDLIRVIMQEAAGVLKTGILCEGSMETQVAADEKASFQTTSAETPDVLRVELLKLSTVLLEYVSPLLKIYKKEMIKYPWNSIKSEDYSTKYWSYVNICRFVASFESPSKIIIQVYVALLRAYTSEGKDIVRYALDILVPVLPFRINTDDMMKIIKWTKKIHSDEGVPNPPQLIHIWQMIVKHGDVFYPYRSQLTPLIISSVSRIGLHQTTSAEYRQVALNMTDLCLSWEWYRRNRKVDDLKAQSQSEVSTTKDENVEPSRERDNEASLSVGMVNVLANFLLRLGILVADAKDPSILKLYSSCIYLYKKMLRLFESPTLKVPYFDKLIQSAVECSSFVPTTPENLNKPSSSFSEPAMLACLEFLVVSFDNMNKPSVLLSSNINLIKDLLPYLYNNDNPRFQKGIKSLIGKVVAVEDPEFDASLFQSGLFQSLNNLIDNSLLSDRDASQRGHSSEVRRIHSIHCLDEICRNKPEWIDVYGPLMVSIFQTLLMEQLSKGFKQIRSSLLESLNSLESHPSPWATVFSENIARVDGAKNEKIDSWSGSEFLLTLSFLCRCMGQGYLQQQKREILGSINIIIEQLDCVIALNEVSKFCKSWLLAKRSPLSVNEKWMLYSKIVASVDKRPDYVCQPYYIRFISIAEQIGSQFVGSPRSFSCSFGKPSMDSDMALGLLGLWSPLKEFRSKTQSRAFEFWGVSLYEKLIAFFRTNMEPFSSRHLAMLLPSLFFNSADSSSIRFETSSAWKQRQPSQTQRAPSKASVFSVDDGYNKFLERSIQIKSDWKSLLANYNDLCLYHPLVGRAIWTSVLQQLWANLNFSQQQELCLAFEEFVLRSKPKDHILWPFHVPNKIVRSEHNVVQVLLQSFSTLNPSPLFSVDFLGACGSKYSAWYDSVELISKMTPSMSSTEATAALNVVSSLFEDLEDKGGVISSNRRATADPYIDCALSFQAYGYCKHAQTSLFKLICSYQANDDQVKASTSCLQVGVVSRWIDTAKELSQWKVLSDLAENLHMTDLGFEVAALNNDWDKLKRLRLTPTISAESSLGKIEVKLCDVMLSIVDSRHSDTEKLYVQSIQLALNRWQQLPEMYSGSFAHKKVMHNFQRIMEYRDSFSVIVECIKAIREKKLQAVNLKRLRDLWRSRLPDESLDLQSWHSLMQWRILTFERIKAIYSIHPVQQEVQLVCNSNDDSNWCILNLAKIARKQSMYDVSLTILSRLNEMDVMDVDDVFDKLREQIFVYHSRTETVEDAVNLIASTNMNFFSPAQNAELVRLKGLCFIKSDNANSANECFILSTNLCNSHAKTWLSWGNFAYDNIPLTVDLSNVDNVITSIVCILKAIEYKSTRASALLGRVVWLMTEKWGQDPRVVKAFDDNSKTLRWSLWLPFLHILVSACGHGNPFRSIVEFIALNNPNAVIYHLLSERDSNPTKNTSDVTQLIEKLGKGLEGILIAKAVWFTAYIKEITCKTWAEVIYHSFVDIFRTLSTNFTSINPTIESLNSSLNANTVEPCYTDLQVRLMEEFSILKSQIGENDQGQLFEFLCKWIRVLSFAIVKIENGRNSLKSTLAFDTFNISQQSSLLSTNTSITQLIQVKGVDYQYLDIPCPHFSCSALKVKLIRIHASSKVVDVNNIFYRRFYLIGDDGRSYAFNAGYGNVNTHNIYNIIQAFNWTLKQYRVTKKMELSLKLMILPIPITSGIIITRVHNDHYTSLCDLFKEHCASIGEDFFKPKIDGRNLIQNTLNSKTLNAAKIDAYNSGKAIVPLDLLQNYFYDTWHLSIEYYSKRILFAREVGLNGGFQLLINGNPLSAEEFIVTHNGSVDSGFYTTSYEITENKIKLNDFDNVALRLTRNIQKIVNVTSIDIIISTIGSAIDAFMTNIEAVEIALQFYFIESLRCSQLPTFFRNEEELILSSKLLTQEILRKIKLYSPSAIINSKIPDKKSIDFNIKEVVEDSANELNIALMDLHWSSLL